MNETKIVLQGTEKQIAWANSIRNKFLREIESVVLDFSKSGIIENPILKRNMKEKFGIENMTHEQQREICHRAIEKIKKETSASWYIENRDETITVFSDFVLSLAGYAKKTEEVV